MLSSLLPVRRERFSNLDCSLVWFLGWTVEITCNLIQPRCEAFGALFFVVLILLFEMFHTFKKQQQCKRILQSFQFNFKLTILLSLNTDQLRQTSALNPKTISIKKFHKNDHLVNSKTSLVHYIFTSTPYNIYHHQEIYIPTFKYSLH
jgi:hypothetical protein